MLHDLNIRDTVPPEKIRKRLESIVAGEQIELDVHQEEAVIEAVNNGLLIITGGPGNRKDHHHQHDHPVF